MKSSRLRGRKAVMWGLATSVVSLALVGGAPLARADEVFGDWAFSISGNSATITAWAGNCNDHPDLWTYTGTPCSVIANGGSLTVPATLGGKPVTSIGDGAIQASLANGGTGATSLDIPSTVTSIGVFALTNFNSVTALSLPPGLERIGISGLANLGVDSYPRPEVLLPESLLQLEGGALGGVTVSASAVLLAHLTDIGGSVFSGHSFSSTPVHLDSIRTLGPEALRNAGIASLTLGSSLSDMFDWGIGGTFRDNSITTISIPGSLHEIPQYAFYNNPLTSVTIGSGATAIGEGAFSNPTATHAITSLTLPASITTIGNSAFDGSLSNSVASLTLPRDLTSIGDYAFHEARLGALTLNANLQAIGAHAFDHALSPGVTSVTIPPGVSSIGDYAFANNGISSVTIPASVRTMGSSAFATMPAPTITYVPPVFSGLSPATANVGTAYSTTFGASGASLAVRAGDTLPDGLTLDPDTGILSGIPTTAGTFTFHLVATNADPASSANAASPSNGSPYTSGVVTLTIAADSSPSPSQPPSNGGSDPASAPLAGPTPTPSVSVAAVPTSAPSAVVSSAPANTFAVVPASVSGVVASGVTAVSSVPAQGVQRVVATVADNPVNAPVVSAPMGSVVATTLSGLEANTDFAVTISPVVRSRSLSARAPVGALGHVRSNSKGLAKLPAIKVTKSGVYVIQLQTASGTAHYVKMAVKPSPKRGKR